MTYNVFSGTLNPTQSTMCHMVDLLLITGLQLVSRDVVELSIVSVGYTEHQMFRVSSLRLDDALEPATPLSNGVINGIAGLSASPSSKMDTLNI